MYVIVGGAGEVGYNVAKALREEGHEVAVIETRSERLDRLQDLDVAVIAGNLASKTVLEGEARIRECQLFIACSGDDEINMVAASLAKTYGCRTIARINDTEYLNVPTSTEYAKMGIDVAVCPEMVAAIRIKRMLNQPRLMDADVLAQGKVIIAEGRIKEGAFVVGKRLDEVEPPAGFHLFAIYRGEDVLIPKASVRLQAHDRMMMALTSIEVLKDVEAYIGRARPLTQGRDVRRVMVAGGTRIGIQLARLLEQSKRDVVLVEKDPELARAAGERLQKALVVQGDVTDRNVLIQENVDTFDAFIGATKVEEYNVLGALIAKQLGVPLTVVMINQPELKGILESLDIDLAVAPRLSTVGAILQQVHGGAEEVALQNVGGERLMVLKVGDAASAVGQKIKSIPFPDGSTLVAIVRGEQVVLPRGEDTVEAGDTAIAFSAHVSAEALERLFA
ncbi:MAG TPA: Trk system potassium transporter TrkA [Candidatus Thermoplasmatota archaeon]|nr:Trk system potassium transporter TrkA [Candidatus Thermoplasmatota archaeon]